MLKKRNAAELSINIIILVVLGLIVLLVMMYIFSNQSGKTVNTLNSCGSRGGNCVDDGSCKDGSSIPNLCPKGSDGKDKICCVTIK